MSKLTTLKIGGPAKYFCIVKTDQELIDALNFSKEKKLSFIVIGGGSNLLVSDKGFYGLVIKFDSFGIKQCGGILTVRAGTSLQDLVDYTIKKGLGGMNKMTGIPGTVGGAVYGAAGAYGHNIVDFMEEVTTLNPKTLKTETFSKAKSRFSYRNSIFKKNKHTILRVIFKNLPKDTSSHLLKESKDILRERLKKYPPNLKSPGSFFKNIVADDLTKDLKEILKKDITYGKIPAGRLVELVGGKGDKLGQIMIAQNHGNTFINLGQGTARDFYKLAKKYHKKVYEKFGIFLEPEVQLINLPPLH